MHYLRMMGNLYLVKLFFTLLLFLQVPLTGNIIKHKRLSASNRFKFQTDCLCLFALTNFILFYSTYHKNQQKKEYLLDMLHSFHENTICIINGNCFL